MENSTQSKQLKNHNHNQYSLLETRINMDFNFFIEKYSEEYGIRENGKELFSTKKLNFLTNYQGKISKHDLRFEKVKRTFSSH